MLDPLAFGVELALTQILRVSFLYLCLLIWIISKSPFHYELKTSFSFLDVIHLCYSVVWFVSCATGLVPFAIGSETAGSITYPAARCGVTALRPTFGTVGRTGVMSLSESLVQSKFPCSFIVWCCECKMICNLSTRISLALSVDLQLIVLLFWILFGEEIPMISHQDIAPLMIHSMLTLLSWLLDILMMLKWRFVIQVILQGQRVFDIIYRRIWYNRNYISTEIRKHRDIASLIPGSPCQIPFTLGIIC